MDKILNDFTSIVRKAVDEYHMIDEGDRIAVGVSGGKDSMMLLRSLRHLQGYYPKHFDLEAVTVELGFEGMDFAPVREMCRQLGIPYNCVVTDIREIVFDIRREDNPCSLCAKMRRGAINSAIMADGYTKLALGHHFDDAVETFMMSLMFEGRLSCFRPVTFMDRSGVTQIRPLIYAGEQKIANVAAQLELADSGKSLSHGQNEQALGDKADARGHVGGETGSENKNFRRHAAAAAAGLGAGRKSERGRVIVYYRIIDRVLTPSDMSEFGMPEPGLGLMTLEEAAKQKDVLSLDDFELESCRRPVKHFHAGMESRDDHSLILINAINRDNVDEDDRIAFLMHRNKLVLIVIKDADDSISGSFSDVIKKHLHGAAYESVVYDLFAQFLDCGQEILDDTEEQMNGMERDITGKSVDPDMNGNICLLRNRMSRVKRYFNELVDVGEALQEDDGEILDEQCRRFMRRFTDKASRLAQTAQVLSDNLVYLREELSAALDYNMNRTMKILTVISAIFLPLTLIVGWYGMNFRNMPELEWEYGYIGVAVLCIAVVAVCVVFFKKKKYF
jgi:magnesium/cobalt transport protein CorA